MAFLDRRNVFLIDGIGAFASASFTGVILPLFSERTGLPDGILHGLALIAVLLGAWSLFCHWMQSSDAAKLLLITITANLLYCVLSVLVLFLVDGVRTWGVYALVAEIGAILVVVGLELKVYFSLARA